MNPKINNLNRIIDIDLKINQNPESNTSPPEPRIQNCETQTSNLSTINQQLESQVKLLKQINVNLIHQIYNIHNSEGWKILSWLYEVRDNRIISIFLVAFKLILTKSIKYLHFGFKDPSVKKDSAPMIATSKGEPTAKPKITYLIPYCSISGGVAVVCQHLNRLLDRGYDVSIISADEQTNIDWFPSQKVPIIPLSKAPSEFDILVATGWSTAYTVMRLKARKKYYFVQSDESRFYPIGSGEYFEAINTYFFDFTFFTEAIWIQEWLSRAFRKNSFYAPNGLDPDIFHRTELLEPKKRIRVLLEGPIDIPFKGMEDAFMAVQNLDCEVWCVSSHGVPKKEWRCDRLFTKVKMTEMKNIYSSCDILLKMSRVEGFFGPPLEMMACGGTAVVSKVTGYDEYIIDGYNALVVEPRDVEGAKDAVNKLINDRELREKLIRNGAETVQNWKWDRAIDTLEKEFTKE